jgi:hypothetical protein
LKISNDLLSQGIFAKITKGHYLTGKTEWIDVDVKQMCVPLDEDDVQLNDAR